MDQKKFHTEKLCLWIWMGFGFIAVLLCGNMKRFGTVISFRSTYEQKYRLSNREISPPPLSSVSFLPRRVDPTCSLTLLTDTDNYSLLIGGSLHASTCLFAGFFLLVCETWVLWWHGIFKWSTHEYDNLDMTFFFHSGTSNHENFTSYIVCVIHSDHDCSAGYITWSFNHDWSFVNIPSSIRTIKSHVFCASFELY